MAIRTTKTRAISQKNRGRLAQMMQHHEGLTLSSDGTEIYYKSVGKGFPIILCNGLGVSTFFWKYFENHFKHQFQVISWDYRGHGRSAPPIKESHVSVAYLVEDCWAVCQTLKIKKAIFVGHSLGSQVVLEFYRRHPQWVKAIISCFGIVGRPMDFFYNSRLSKYLFEILSTFGLKFPKQSSFITQILMNNPFWFQLGGLFKMMNTGMANKADAQEYIDHILSLEPTFFSKLSRSVQSHSAEGILKNVKVPCLVLGAEEDTFSPAWIAQKIHRVIPRSELFMVRKGSHAALVEQPDLINLRIEKFIRERVRLPKKNSPNSSS